ncbi:hypothetical protein QZH41_010343, partial [Actinostola sp. cb2023]
SSSSPISSVSSEANQFYLRSCKN